MHTQPSACVRLAADCLLKTPRSRVARWRVPPLPAWLLANKLTHWLLEAEVQVEGEAVQLQDSSVRVLRSPDAEP